MNRIKIPEGADTVLIAFNGEMSKMDNDQREAMRSLNDGAKAVLAEREERDMKEIDTLKVDTPFKEAHGKDIAVPKASYADIVVPEEMTPLLPQPDKCLPDPLAPIDGYDPNVDREGAYLKTTLLRYTQETLAVEFERIFKDELMALRNAGQKEYAHDDSSPFANFERGAKDAGLDRKQVLWIYAMKHKDGIAAALQGHTSQREDVRGRINDLIVYLLLMRGMYNEEFGGTGNFGLGDKA